MARKHYYKSGQNLIVCDRCGGVYPSVSIKTEWTGALVCYGQGTRDCYEEKQPLLYFRTKGEQIAAKETRTTTRDAIGFFILMENSEGSSDIKEQNFLLQEDGYSLIEIE
jgi:hypothetical protein